jgi:hypothetical protein
MPDEHVKWGQHEERLVGIYRYAAPDRRYLLQKKLEFL